MCFRCFGGGNDIEGVGPQIVLSASYSFLKGTYPDCVRSAKFIFVILLIYLLNRPILLVPTSAIKENQTCSSHVLFCFAFPLFRWAGFHQLMLKRTNELKTILC